ncbi:MAG: hypothetical protein ACLPH3_00750, partial [Terracidiphilus sp.]
TTSAGFEFPSIFLETGLLMPARLATLRLSGRESRLTDAVQKLTGLDDLVAIGGLVEGLCHKSREYLSYRKKDLSTATNEFEQAIEAARVALSALKIVVPDFVPANTDDEAGEMTKFGKMLTDRAGELTQVISTDLTSGLALENPSVQIQVVSAIAAAQEDIGLGLEGLQSWKFLQPIVQALDDGAVLQISNAIAIARKNADEAIRLLERSQKDSKFQLKALAAQWYVHNKSGAIQDCPLCEHSLGERPLLVQDLEELRSAGDAAARAFHDNLNTILAELESSLPASLRRTGSEVLKWEPRANLVEDLRSKFITNERYIQILSKFGTIVGAALSAAPEQELAGVTAKGNPGVLDALNERITVIERLIDFAAWFRLNSDLWSKWWQGLAHAKPPEDPGAVPEENSAESAPESLSAHLSRLSDALSNPGWKAALVFLDDVEHKGGGHDPDQASEWLSPKRVRVHAVSTSPCS